MFSLILREQEEKKPNIPHPSDKTVFLCRGSPLAPEVLKYLAGFDILGQAHHMLSRFLNLQI